MCEACAGFAVDGQTCCEACARDEEALSRDLGAALLALVGVGYLTTLALGYVLFHARPFIGGLAAVVAIALGRALQLLLRRPVVTRRTAPRT
jgi:hypothetical protein